MKFEINEKVLVYQGPLLYDAKISRTYDPVSQKITFYDEKKKEYIKTSPDKKFPDRYLSETVYKVHYNGWNVKWDEWVDTSRILEDSKENRIKKEELEFEVQEQARLKQEEIERQEKQKELEKGQKRSKTRLKNDHKVKGETTKVDEIVRIAGLLNSSKTDSKNLNGSTSLKRSKKRFGSTGPITDEETDINGEVVTKIKRKKTNDISLSTHYDTQNGFTHSEIQNLVPDELKIILVDDWEMITKNNKLVILSGKHTVKSVLDDFGDYLNTEFKDDLKELSILHEITESIRHCFDQCVGIFVLYRYERPQYNDLLGKGDINFSEIYDAIFLLRLLSIFPSILMLNNVEPNVIKISKAYLDIILHWLNLHREKYFEVEYENQSPWISVMHG